MCLIQILSILLLRHVDYLCIIVMFLSAVWTLILTAPIHYGCPILLSPLDVVVEYGASFSVNCSYSATHQFGLSWDGFDDTVEESEEIFRFVDKVTDWETNLTCYMSSNETQCSQDLPITIYKTPDSVFISTVNHRGPMTEGQQYELQCDVHNVAPVQNLTVKWYKGQTLLHQTNFTDTIETPVNETVTLLIRPDRADDGAEYWCEAELDLGAEGPQPHPTNSSKPLSIAVYSQSLTAIITSLSVDILFHNVTVLMLFHVR
uniref:Ig-like domain-containing protein n=1 Tax=Cyprinus carpio TaxID=7962 RepID=A0A8C2IDI5_CYPCA